MCVCLHVGMCMWLQVFVEARVSRSPGTAATNNCELDPLEEDPLNHLSCPSMCTLKISEL